MVRDVPCVPINLPVQVREQPAALIFPPHSDSAGKSVGGYNKVEGHRVLNCRQPSKALQELRAILQ